MGAGGVQAPELGVCSGSLGHLDLTVPTTSCGAGQGRGVLQGQDGQEASTAAWHPFSGAPTAARIPPTTGLSPLSDPG